MTETTATQKIDVAIPPAWFNIGIIESLYPEGLENIEGQLGEVMRELDHETDVLFRELFNKSELPAGLFGWLTSASTYLVLLAAHFLSENSVGVDAAIFASAMAGLGVDKLVGKYNSTLREKYEIAAAAVEKAFAVKVWQSMSDDQRQGLNAFGYSEELSEGDEEHANQAEVKGVAGDLNQDTAEKSE